MQDIPFSSGVYLMKDAQGEVIYVGKAVSLRKRVQSYFRRSSQIDPKKDKLVAAIRGIETIETNSEAEALLLEASLIKQYRPKFNIELRDDKSYPYIDISDETFPRVSVVRPNAKKKGPSQCGRPRYRYGPYVNPRLVREALKIIRRIFHFRTCDPFPDKACLDYHIGLCDAPCEKKTTRKEYSAVIRNVRLILEGKKDKLYRGLQKEMEAFAAAKEYEKAAHVRDQMRSIGALYSGTRDINYYKEAEQIQRAFNLPRLPERIECFDISNIMGSQAAGAMVSFFNGKPDKANCRRFRIRDVDRIDDFRMIAEVVRRRYRRLKAENRLFPDLVLIDGGKGQLSAALAELDALDADIPVVALAKRQEEVFLPRRRSPVVLPRDSLGLRLIQRVRDEAHRFAVRYHRTLRRKHSLGRA